MRSLLPFLLIGLLVALPVSVYRDYSSQDGVFVLQDNRIEAGGTLTGLVALGGGNIRPAEQAIPTEVMVVGVGNRIVAEASVGNAEALEVNYYVLDRAANVVREGKTYGTGTLLLELDRPEAPGEYIFHVTVRSGDGISTAIDAFRIP